MTLGKRIADKRKELGLDQYQLAERLGVSQSTLCDWENDEMMPRRARLPVISKVLGWPVKVVKTWWAQS